MLELLFVFWVLVGEIIEEVNELFWEFGVMVGVIVEFVWIDEIFVKICEFDGCVMVIEVFDKFCDFCYFCSIGVVVEVIRLDVE